MSTTPSVSFRNTEAPPLTSRRTLVTGGAGFIGSHLVTHLIERGDHLTVIDNLSTGRRSNLPDVHPRLRLIESDLSAALAALTGREHFDEVYHLAAAVGVRLIIEQPIRSIETNVDQTAALLRFVAAHPCPVLIASSSEVYGKSTKSPFSEDDDVVYGPTTATRWSYACSKAIDEFLALAYHAQHRVPTVIARFFNTVGPRQVGEYGMVLPRFVRAVLSGESPEIYGDGSASRCFCDVRDVVRVLPKVLAEPRCHGRIFNIGSDRPITMSDLADLVSRTLGVPAKAKRIPYGEAYPPGFEDLKQRQPDLRRVRDAVGFHPSIPLEQTIRDIADEFRRERGLA